jgi:hypothetical protein
MRHLFKVITLASWAIVFCLAKSNRQAAIAKGLVPAPLTTPSATALGGTTSVSPLRAPGRQQIDVSSLSREQVAAEVKRRDAMDSKWEWKTPIQFYGRAMDEAGKPVPSANVHFQWTDLSAQGTTEADMTTDSRGLFALDNVQGKRLLVRVTKAGYYSSDARNRLSFEFANPFEEIYYQPNAAEPVLFHLRKQIPAANLVVKSVEIVLPGDGTSTKVRLETGQMQMGGELQVQALKPWPPRPMSPPYAWKVIFTIKGGGFVEAPDEFAFEAPDTAYSEPYTIDMSTRLGSAWKVSAEKTLYFAYGEPRRYGRLTLRTDGNSRYIFVNYVINPSGSRNLEDTNSLK